MALHRINQILFGKLHTRTVLWMLVIFLMIPCGCINEEHDDAVEVVRIGDKLPDFMALMNDSTTVTGEKLRESVSVVMFFHTSCPDCQQTLPHIQQLYNKYAPQGVAFTLISRGEEDASIAAYWESNGLTLPYSPQTDWHVYELFAKQRIPRIYISNPKGVVQYIFTDNPAPSYKELDEALQTTMTL
ncbi:MAG: TlpA family protein disulfide reductase [Bacteroidaceae bacterium]|nr:TlpA family protein disulfide reductase [Bacteroidaceae bacterium]